MCGLVGFGRQRWLRLVLVTVLALVVLASLPLTPASAATANPFAGIRWVPNAPDEVNNDPTLRIVAAQQSVEWFGDWYSDSELAAYVDQRINAIAGAGGTPLFAIYNIPYRDCGEYSSGGVATAVVYRQWVDRFVSALRGRQAIIFVEPDGLTVTNCLSPQQLQERYSLIGYAVQAIKRNARASAYLDAGNEGWYSATDMGRILTAANIAQADGFLLNGVVYDYTSKEVAYGRQISAAVGGKHFVVGTSRNGLGSGGQGYCNAPGRALGVPPTTRTGDPLVDAFIWLKPPWESDGECGRGEPPAGALNLPYLRGLVARAQQPFSDMPSDPIVAEELRQLTLRGYIRGNGDGTFGTQAFTQRGHMAALITRPLAWELESWPAPFPDQDGIGAELWRNVGTLAHYRVALGFSDGLFRPTSPISYQQVLLFISRGMVTKGYWQLQPDNPAYFPNIPGSSPGEISARRDIATYIYYTQTLGGVPDNPASGNFATWDQPVPRIWFARALYRALKSADLL